MHSGTLSSPEKALIVSDSSQKKRERARVAHSRIISVIMVTYSFINSMLSESMATHCSQRERETRARTHTQLVWASHISSADYYLKKMLRRAADEKIC